MPATRTDFETHARQEGLPVPLTPRVRDAILADGLSIPVNRRQLSVVLAPFAGTCNLDGFDCRVCDARTKHDDNIVELQVQNRLRQWDLAPVLAAAKLAGEEAKALLPLLTEQEALLREERGIRAQRESQNAQQGHSHCAHCGAVVRADQHPALHAPAGYEHTALRLEVVHCDACARSEHCAFDRTSPGSGLPDGVAGGFCEFPNQSVSLGAELFPGARFIVKTLGLALSALGLYVMSTLLVHSQGQQVADLTGTTGAIAVQDSTSGHGYNAGTISLYTSSAPASANAAETGTDLVDVTLPNPLFGAPSGLPSVATANAITAATISNSGTAGYGRVKANGDTGVLSTTERRMQITVGTSAADAILNTLSLVSGGSLTVTSMTYQHAA